MFQGCVNGMNKWIKDGNFPALNDNAQNKQNNNTSYSQSFMFSLASPKLQYKQWSTNSRRKRTTKTVSVFQHGGGGCINGPTTPHPNLLLPTHSLQTNKTETPRTHAFKKKAPFTNFEGFIAGNKLVVGKAKGKQLAAHLGCRQAWGWPP